MARTFRLSKRYNLSAQLDATNVLNHVVYSGWNTTINPSQTSALSQAGTILPTQFGAPSGTNGMRTIQITMRLRF
jgi:hypothetical protein